MFLPTLDVLIAVLLTPCDKKTNPKLFERRLIDNNFLKDNMNLIIEPKPDEIIRRIFYFKPCSEKIELNEPIVETPNRKGFTVVEWGGLLDN